MSTNWVRRYKSLLISGDKHSDETFTEIMYDMIQETDCNKEELVKYLSIGIKKELHDEIVSCGQEAVIQRYESFNPDEDYCFITDCRIQQEIDGRHNI